METINFMERIKNLQEMQKKKRIKYTKPKCKTCNDTYNVLNPITGCYYECACVKRDKAIKQWGELGMDVNNPKTFANFEETDIEITIAKLKAVDYATEFNGKQSFLIVGQSGSGKTHLCQAIFKELIQKDVFIKPMIYREKIIELKQSINDVEYTKEMQRLKNADVLFIDDLFKGGFTESDIRIMFELIDYRYRKNLPVIVSTELNKEKLLNIDEALASRIFQMSKNYTVIIAKNSNSNFRL